MYLRITRARYDPARADEVVALSGQVNADVKRLPGCQGIYLGTDRAAGKTAAVSVWDTKEHAQFSRDTAISEVVGRLLALGVQFEPPEILEIVG